MNSLSHSSYILLMILVIFSPLLASIYAAFWGNRSKSIHVGIFNSFCIFVSFISALILLFCTTNGYIQNFTFTLMDWINLDNGNLFIKFSFLLDPISAIMILVVSLVSLLVHIYSIGYMENDPAFNRYFSYLSAFVFSMMVLVMSDNFIGLFIGWEGVGVCSYLLIGFWYKRESANKASIEAFVMNRIADLGMLIGIIMIYWHFGSFDYNEVFNQIYNIAMSGNSLPSWLYVIGILLFIGAMGKSAQFPLHTWLANAMEGPTPVSALIHAATMVTAGVYLLIRSHSLYSIIPEVGYFIACLGAFVAIFAASMALLNRDLKRIIAYSTLSQLGYMFVAAGLGAYNIALFHLFTHAFFKALLFLGAGNVMHAMEDKLDITKMGSLYKPLKFTMILMIIASLALSGIYPFAGFFSKDKILEFAFNQNHHFLWFVLLIGAMMTAFYSFRLIMLVFFGKKSHSAHPHEAKKFMLWSMVPLAILAIIAGFFEHNFSYFISKVIPSHEENISHLIVSVLIFITSILAILSILYAIFRYKNGFKEKPMGLISKILFNQYYIPEFYDKVFVKSYIIISNFLWRNIEIKLIDATVDSIGKFLVWLSRILQSIQNGNLTKSLRLMSFGIFVMLIFTIISFWR